MAGDKVDTQRLLKGLSQLLELKDKRYDDEHKKVLEEKGLDNYSLTELHVIHCIGEESMRNLTTISEYMAMTRGAISKICHRLQKKGAIEKMKMADNQKEVFFILTSEGQRLFKAHEVLHQQSQTQWAALFDKYNGAEKQVIQRFFDDVITHLRC
ncbi:MAG TPA: MarR family transcriptional regulator [Proteus sp.]|uniref:MarR family transcriptional regulator n=1 Tax=Proteus hauseri ATCC 700826 TaxID=1354271 RepID=A0AAJ3LUM4_PROHU|nr:MarR family transcriptional regulator [Proteus hauseri]OAT48876.1 MarR family transcriptional regulator [Proteus hauseri ATCC 700826]HCH49672.1 MarR family transcriptional regulator [Proteus sp. (in: enterobacteria)]